MNLTEYVEKSSNESEGDIQEFAQTNGYHIIRDKQRKLKKYKN